MKPDQYRIESRTLNDAHNSKWGCFQYQSAFHDSSVIKRASALSNDFSDADWRVMRYSEILDEWILIWEQAADKPVEFEHANGITVKEREEFPGALSLVGPDGFVFGYVSKNEADALRGYFVARGM